MCRSAVNFLKSIHLPHICFVFPFPVARTTALDRWELCVRLVGWMLTWVHGQLHGAEPPTWIVTVITTKSPWHKTGNIHSTVCRLAGSLLFWLGSAGWLELQLWSASAPLSLTFLEPADWLGSMFLMMKSRITGGAIATCKASFSLVFLEHCHFYPHAVDYSKSFKISQ